MKKIENQLDELIHVAHSLQPLMEDISEGASVILSSLKGGGKLFTCGNGGSAADALHLAEELLGRYDQDRIALPAICLCADASTISCISNDFGYESIFERQLSALGKESDVLVGFSTSGNSENVVRAFQKAKKMGIKTIFLGGKLGGKLISIADQSIIVPSQNTARIQEIHTFILHCWLECIDEEYS